MAIYSNKNVDRIVTKTSCTSRKLIFTLCLLFLVLLLILITLVFEFSSKSTAVKNENDGYQHCPKLQGGKINLHILAHSHCDVAWLKTFDQYYYGTNLEDDNSGVQFILNSVIDELLKDQNRRFVFVEIAFFWKWWNEQTSERQSQVKRLVENGQLEFAGGGWSMNDEATTSYLSVIDNFAWGLRKLDEMFGNSVMARPKVGWQIDPFGHSREQASIFAQLGYDGVFLNRIDYRDKAFRFKNKNAEFVWISSPNLGITSSLFSTIMFNHYSPPVGFHFGYHKNNDAIVDEVESSEYNVEKRVKRILNEVSNKSKMYNTSNIFIQWGDDFTFENAGNWFKSIDKIIKYINNNNTKYNIFYSTPGCYVKSVNSDKTLLLSTKEDDFFPYIESDNSYWTGYYTTRPSLKYYISLASNFLQICKQLMVLANVNETYNNGALNKFRSTIALMQHHDSITGTSKQHVINDYNLQLTKSISNCEVNADYAIKNILSKKSNNINSSEKDLFKFTSCTHTNISDCAISESGKPIIVTLYNPLSHPVTHYVRLPVAGDGLVSYKVLNPQSEEEVVQLVPIPDEVIKIPGRKSHSTFEIVFKAENIPPLGLRSYYVSPSNDPSSSSRLLPTANIYTIGNINKTAITIDGTSNQVKGVFSNGKMYPFLQYYLYYESIKKPKRGKPSGAYIFNPTINDPKPISFSKPQIKILTGDVVDEVHQTINKWFSQVIRIYKNEDHLEIEWLVGPLNVLKNLIGKEVIIRYSIPDLLSNQTFFTDSNGKEIIRRIRNPVSVSPKNNFAPGNYYPVTSRIMINDKEKQLTIITDRPEGGSSLHDGEIELMVHRESLYDDQLGIGESLTENIYAAVVRGKHYVSLGNVKTRNYYDKMLIKNKRNPVWTFLTQINSTSFSKWNEHFRTEFSGIKSSIPQNVRILSLEPWNYGQFLLRLEHIFEKNEHEELSKPALVDLEDMFFPFNITSAKEMTLGGNFEIKEKIRLKWSIKYNSESIKVTEDNNEENNVNGAELNLKKIILHPMQIRTFIVNMIFK